MTQNTKRFSVVRELHEIITIRRSVPFKMFCDGCRMNGDFITLAEAVVFLQIGTQEVLRKIEANGIHSSDAPNGQILVCVRSLAR